MLTETNIFSVYQKKQSRNNTDILLPDNIVAAIEGRL